MDDLRNRLLSRQLEREPRRPSFEELLSKWPRVRDASRASRFACSSCDGEGRVRDPSFERDPIEGYKLAPRVSCPACGGSKTTTREAVDKAISMEIARAARLHSSWQNDTSELASALSKLSDRQVFLIRGV